MFKQTDWHAIRRQYEVMHTDVEELASCHNVSKSVIQSAVDTEKWGRKVITEEMVTALSDKAANLASLSDADLVTKFITLQSKLLDKCDIMLDQIDTVDNAAHLKLISEIIEKHRPAMMRLKREADKGDGLTIRILNRVGDGSEACISAIEISQSAGATNGQGAMTRGIDNLN